MSDLALNREDVEKVRAAAQKTNDRIVDNNHGDCSDDEACTAVIEFCDVLLGLGTVDGFLRAQDMEG